MALETATKRDKGAIVVTLFSIRMGRMTGRRLEVKLPYEGEETHGAQIG